MTQLKVVLNKFYDEYVHNTPKKLKLVDAYLVYIVLTGITQFVYCCLVGSFPFNSFLSGFISTISCFILGGKSIINCQVFQFNAVVCLNFSLFATPSESTEQGDVPGNYSGAWIRRLYLGSRYITHCRHEFPRIGVSYFMYYNTSKYTQNVTIHKLYIPFLGSYT